MIAPASALHREIDRSGETPMTPAETVRAAMNADRRATLYLVREGSTYRITNGHGDLRLTPHRVSIGRHNIAGTQIHVWFDLDGQPWHGVHIGHHNTICHCTALKTPAPAAERSPR